MVENEIQLDYFYPGVKAAAEMASSVLSTKRVARKLQLEEHALDTMRQPVSAEDSGEAEC